MSTLTRPRGGGTSPVISDDRKPPARPFRGRASHDSRGPNVRDVVRPPPAPLFMAVSKTVTVRPPLAGAGPQPCGAVRYSGVLALSRSMCGHLQPKVAATVSVGWKLPAEAVDYMWWKPPGKMTAERVAHVVIDLRVVSQRTVHPNATLALAPRQGEVAAAS